MGFLCSNSLLYFLLLIRSQTSGFAQNFFTLHVWTILLPEDMGCYSDFQAWDASLGVVLSGRLQGYPKNVTIYPFCTSKLDGKIKLLIIPPFWLQDIEIKLNWPVNSPNRLISTVLEHAMQVTGGRKDISGHIQSWTLHTEVITCQANCAHWCNSSTMVMT